LAPLLFTGCVGGFTASSQVEVGDAFATYELGKVSPTDTVAQKAAVLTLQRVSSDLLAFTNGTLTQQELGSVTETLNEQKLSISGNTKAVDQLNNLLNIFQTQIVVGPGGAVTPTSALEAGVITNAKAGIDKSIQYFEGKWSVSNPSGWPTTSKADSALPWQVYAMR
jgi:hypothetical protein